MSILNKISDKHFLANRIAKYTDLIHTMAVKRFSVFSGWSFQTLKKISNYHNFQKRDSGIVNSAKSLSGTLFETALHKAILHHFREIHNKVADITAETSFPKLLVYDRALRAMADNVTPRKAINFDGISDSLFDFRSKCTCPSRTCSTCSNLLDVLRNLTTP